MAKRNLKIGQEIGPSKPKRQNQAPVSYVLIAAFLILCLMLMLYVLRVLRSLGMRPEM
jgi:hypothetical protein